MAKMTETQKLRLKQKAKSVTKTGIAAARTAGKVAVKVGRNIAGKVNKVTGKQLAALRRNLEKARAAISNRSATPARGSRGRNTPRFRLSPSAPTTTTGSGRNRPRR